jgi:hypothetical protein
VKHTAFVLGLVTLLTAPSIAWSQGAEPAAAQADRYAVLVQGASGEEAYAALHRGWLDKFVGVLRDRLGFDAARLTVLAEKPKAGEQPATAESVKSVLGRIATQAKPADVVFIMLIGHASSDGAEAKFNLVGPDLTVSDWNALLKQVKGRITFVDTSSVSFPFLKGLAAPDRVVITATNSGGQRYATVFASGFIDAFTAEVADADKNGRISMLEAFVYASRQTAQHYEQANRLATEHSVFDDTGDGVGSDGSGTGSDGVVAGVTYLDVAAAPKVADPELQKLLLQQRALNEQLDDLRRRRNSMPSDVYDKEFESIVAQLAVISREIRRKGGGG